ncbi:hypothetical protein [Mesorhizobium sp. LCM 4577]|uniref:hypothetical protein n=1 Tax=Mesorhizobium sp. LCM 4577 TaxID=1848288 RepID=UPI001041D345|nr:hypothetical protein [Mesorhizobium sp. LCM 4577]
MTELGPSSDATLRRCPKCDSLIPLKAVVCPVCKSDIKAKTAGQEAREHAVDLAKFIRDWIGFPAATIAAIAALTGPAWNNVLAWLDMDHAKLDIKFVKADFMNFGLDDRGITEQADEVFVTLPYTRFILSNIGIVPATVRSDFTCVRGNETGDFYFIDLNTNKRLPATFIINPNESMQVDAVRDSDRPHDNSQHEGKLCTLEYSDKHGNRTYPTAMDDASLFPLDMGSIEDRRIALRAQFCPNMVKGMRLVSDAADCVDGSHVFAIEPIYLWEKALQRAVAQSVEFHQFTQTENRAPGLILTGCDQPNCAQATAQMMQALHSFTPKLTVWLCPGEYQTPRAPDKVVLDRDCKNYNFPTSEQESKQ